MIVSRADEARDDRRYEAAAALYEEALRLAPNRVGLLIQRAHMLKESGRLAAAETHYEAARQLRPDDADLALQQGHFYKTAGRLTESLAAYERALVLKPDWTEAATERDHVAGMMIAQGVSQWTSDRSSSQQVIEDRALAASDPAVIAHLAPVLAPRAPEKHLRHYRPGIDVRRFGRHEHGFWGNARTVRGVEAIRGFCISSRPIVEVQVLVNGMAVHRGPVKGGFPLVHDRHPGHLLKYVFNIWFDFSGFGLGRHKMEILCIDSEEEVHAFHDGVVIAAPLDFVENAASDAMIPVCEADPAKLEAAIFALPSEVRPAKRTMLPHPPRNVLVMRTDQLGDVISSMAAMRRLRELTPGAHIVGLLTAANADIARTLSLFDEIIVIDFPDDKEERRRLMTLRAQEALRRQLAPYAFDLAIDLSQSDVSRPLLLLSGAPFLYGVGGGDWPWLTGEFGLNTHDRLNRLDRVPHSNKTLALIETLGALLRSTFRPERRTDLEKERLSHFGLPVDARYVVLHMGARIEFSRWPRFCELAERVLNESGHHVVMMTEDAAMRATLPSSLSDNRRFHLLDQRLAFDDFDAFVSFADVLVGNDSGPKHLASLRGIHVVTLFTARINWMEWGQEEIGTIISRRVPCAGCAIFHDAEECGKDFTCIRDIAVDEVFRAMKLNTFGFTPEIVG